MNENRAEIKAKIVETEMKKYFGSLVSDFNLIDAFYGNGHEEFSLGFKYCARRGNVHCTFFFKSIL